ncbi:MAG TPA: hypothetical protein VM848_01965 [Acidimicrobiia bacterium]|nr:hypothetical protein [Acidimicrobiia bacterium]
MALRLMGRFRWLVTLMPLLSVMPIVVVWLRPTPRRLVSTFNDRLGPDDVFEPFHNITPGPYDNA